ncbi:LMO1 [Cordylochernes scorpioides]|uniref:LMO1 n=1 Tax=Cordylochernes scorpioides TaxID=51811 RepID=A0ABY6L2F5_9ARAC|nr:LMO1 [Cordylochernes scorpioides]
MSVCRRAAEIMEPQVEQRRAGPGPPAEGPECMGCQKPIRERYLLKALEQFWHEDCLKCACCDCRLGEVGSTLFTKANLILSYNDILTMINRHHVVEEKTIAKFFFFTYCFVKVVDRETIRLDMALVKILCTEAIRNDRPLLSLQQDHPSLRDGDAGEGKRLPSRMFRLSAMQPQVSDWASNKHPFCSIHTI